jgi:hypothetical protein
VEHIRDCRSKSQLHTKAIIALSDCQKFKATTRELKLIKQLPKGEKVFIRTTLPGTYDPLDHIISARANNYWLIDVNPHVLLPSIATNVSF